MPRNAINTSCSQADLEELLRSIEDRFDEEESSFFGGRETNSNLTIKSDGVAISKNDIASQPPPASKEEDEQEEEIGEADLPTLDPLYVSWPELSPAYRQSEEGADASLPPHLRPEWPTDEVCASNSADQLRWDAYPTVFLSPGNKGFE